MPKQKFYVVWKGREPGIYTSWAEAEQQVKGFVGAEFKSFGSLKEARWARAYYKRHRSAGHKHNHALRCLANLHLRILFTMWKNKSCYDENLFLAQRTRNQIANQKT